MTAEAKAEVVRQAHEHRVRHQTLAEDAHRLEAEVPPTHQPPKIHYRGTWLIKISHPLGPCTQTMPRDILWP